MGFIDEMGETHSSYIYEGIIGSQIGFDAHQLHVVENGPGLQAEAGSTAGVEEIVVGGQVGFDSFVFHLVAFP
jgi:hypothetical protein